MIASVIINQVYHSVDNSAQALFQGKAEYTELISVTTCVAINTHTYTLRVFSLKYSELQAVQMPMWLRTSHLIS